MFPRCLHVSFPLALALMAHISSAAGEAVLQILRNGGFEEDEMTFRGEPAASCGGTANDQWFNMRDAFPDGWTWAGVYNPAPFSMPKESEWPRPEVTLDGQVRRSGQFALRLQGTKITLDQTIEWNRVADIYRDTTPAGHRDSPDFTSTIPVRPDLFQDLLLTGWARASEWPDDAAASASLTVHGLASASWNVPRGATDWTRFEVRITAAAQAAAAASGKLTGINLQVVLNTQSPSARGRVWFDDLALTLHPRPEPNLLPDPSFEIADDASKAPPASGRGSNLAGAARPPAGSPYPSGWSLPTKWVYLPPPYYYVWNHWQHFFGACRGYPRIDAIVALSGRQSLRLDLLPGDEYALDSPSLPLNQKELRPLELTAWVKADRLRHIDFMLLDPEGRRLPANTLFTYWGGLASGSHDWLAVRKLFIGYAPLTNVRIRIGARGFNGQTRTDVGHWHAYNQVSTVWIDDVALREVGCTAADLTQRNIEPPQAPSAGPGIRAMDLDLGERLYGENRVSALVLNEGPAPARVALEAVLFTPSGRAQKGRRGKELTAPPGVPTALSAPYEVAELSPSWHFPGRLQVTLWIDGRAHAVETYAYGTWPVVAAVRPSKACLDTTENPILVAVNLGLSAKTLAEVKSLTIEAVHRQTGKAACHTVVEDVQAAIASARINPAASDRFYFYMPRAGLLDHRNLLLAELDIASLTPRPWDNPEAEWVLRITGRGLFRKIFTAESHSFSRLTPFDEKLPPIREVTIDPEGHFYRVDGKPFLPFAQSHANGPANGGAPPSRSVSFHPEHAKVNSFNSLSRWCGIKIAQENWEKANVYAPMVYSYYSPHGHKPQFLLDALPKLDAGLMLLAATHYDIDLRPIADFNASPSSLAYFLRMDEAILEVSAGPEAFQAEQAYADAIRKKLTRPVGIMDNHSQFYPWHGDDGYLDHVDVFYFERESGSVFRPDLALRGFLKRKKTWMLCDLPQTYENVPHERERYRALTNLLNGCRGWFGIQGCADPSLYRALGGELRHLFSYLSSGESQPAVTAPEGVTARAWKKANSVLVIAEQHNPIPLGRWEWAAGVGGRQAPAHTGTSRHLATPVKGGFAIHGYKDDLPRELALGDVLLQEIFISPDRVPQAVLIAVPGDGDFNHVATWGVFDWNEFHAQRVDAFLAGECYSHAAYGINWYRSQEPHWLDYQARHRFPASAFVRLGDLPRPGVWTTLSVPIDSLQLSGRASDGLVFISSGDGLAYWGKSSLRTARGKEMPLLDGRIGRDQRPFRNATLLLPGSDRGVVRVIGEARSIPMAGGQWTDDLMGEDLYDSLVDGYLGDGITYGAPIDALPEALELGYTYDSSPRCLRAYEVVGE
ncbi:MAG: hypothetical protein HYU36_09005 [Planctomycetes bacterium]|nr:hypothetical protein [Planctomycetota bacterium]